MPVFTETRLMRALSWGLMRKLTGCTSFQSATLGLGLLFSFVTSRKVIHLNTFQCKGKLLAGY